MTFYCTLNAHALPSILPYTLLCILCITRTELSLNRRTHIYYAHMHKSTVSCTNMTTHFSDKCVERKIAQASYGYEGAFTLQLAEI